MTTNRCVLIGIILLVISCSCSNNHPFYLNLDFEKVDSITKKAIGWTYFEDDYKVTLDNQERHSGKYSLKIESIDGPKAIISALTAGILYDSIHANQKIKLTGYIKNLNTNSDSLGLYIWCNRVGKTTYPKVLKSENFRGSHNWQEYSIEMTSSELPEYFLFGVQMFGEGTIWVDDLRLYINGNQITNFPQSNNFNANRGEINWLKTNCIPMKTVKAEQGFKDLEPLKIYLKNARIIALGENSHGTSEIFEMKHRFLEFLTCEMGFNILAIESPMFQTDFINGYIAKGEGDPKKYLANLTPAFDTEEFLTMINWMRKINESRKEKLLFTGIDMTEYDMPLKNLTDFARNDQQLRQFVDSLQLVLNNSRFESQNHLSLAIRKCDQILSNLEERKNNKLNTLIQNVRVIKQCFDFYLNGPSSEIRDKYMAENLSWILENNPNSKIVLWAHNGHISKQRGGMGNYISNKYSDQYYSIGFLTNKGKYTGGRQNFISTDNKLVKSKPGSFEFNFGKTKIPYFFLDLNSIDHNNPNSQWLNQRLFQRIIGGNANDYQFYPCVLKENFDGIIFIDSTTPSRTFLKTNLN
jgi:erythromycin esterase